MSYWIVAFTPVAFSERNRPAIASNVSFTVGIASPPSVVSVVSLRDSLEREQVHAAGDREDGAGDVAGALGAKERDRVGDVLRQPFLLHGDPLHHALVE